MVKNKAKQKTTKSKLKNTISTAILSQKVIEKFDVLPKKMVKEIITSFLKEIESNIAKGCKVRIDKIGILSLKDKAARMGRNPQTGESIKIPASKKVRFRCSISLKKALGIKPRKNI